MYKGIIFATDPTGIKTSAMEDRPIITNKNLVFAGRFQVAKLEK
jgi:hypothetical protein